MSSTPRGAGRWTRWSTIAALVLVVGTLVAVVAANSVAHSTAMVGNRAFTRSADEIVARLDLTLQRQADLIIDTSGFGANDPGMAPTTFADWATSIHALDRYPEVASLSWFVLVDATNSPDGPCAVRGELVRQGTPARRANDNPCATERHSNFIRARDTGLVSYSSPAGSPNTMLTIVTPVYDGGTTPATADERRDRFVGWVETRLVPQIVLDRALTGRGALDVSLRYHDEASDVSLIRGDPSNSAEQRSAGLEGGWTVTVGGTAPADGVWSNGTSIALLFGGIALSALLAMLILSLAAGRDRAWTLANDQSDELQRRALHDALTDLPNRTLVRDRVRHLLARNRRTGTEGAALYLGVEGFAEVSDTLGHEAGDHLRQAVASRLTDNLREADTIGRMGSDEFVVLVEGADGNESATNVANRVLDVLHEPFDLPEAGAPITVTTSIGIAVGDRENPADLLRDADVALSQAKVGGGDRFELFGTDLQATVDARREITDGLRSALERDQFRLHYQPVHRLDDMALVGTEALIRWEHPTRGLIAPDDFIPLLESSGRIVDVGRWVLREACSQTMQWRALGHDLTIAVNVSARQLDQDGIVHDVSEALERSGLSAEHLVIEVTETALMSDVDNTARRLRELRDLGVQIAIDDFGTGYASLTYLQRFPVDCIKIDRSFIATIGESRESDRMVHAMVQLGQNLGLRILAEGIETVAQRNFLREEGVDEAQGFLMARPRPPELFLQNLPAPSPSQPSPTPLLVTI